MADNDPLYDHVKRTLAEKKRQSGPGGAPGVGEGFRQVDAAMRGASDVLPFGFADRLASAAYATAHPSDWKARYDASMAAEADHDRQDKIRYPIARRVGQFGMTAATLARAPGLTGVFSTPRLAGAAKITSREALSMLGAGATVGAGTQAVGDLATGKISSPGDYAGAGIGGVAGVATLPFRPDRAAAIDGIVTSVTQDLLNRRPVSIERAGQNAMAARTTGAIANRAAATYTENLAPAVKGPFGETLGALRAIADWAPRKPRGKTPVKIPGEKLRWKPDAMRGTSPHAPDALLFEDKFGRTADLTPNQTLAQAALGDRFHLNRFLPRDIGMAASALGAAIGIQAHERAQPPQPKR